MKNNDSHSEQHETFQIERIALFSDAVFAIAITLLIIEIKVPEVHSRTLTDSELIYQLSDLIPKFIGFLVSFYVIGLYWLSHQRLFKYVTRSNPRFLWRNLFFLLPIIVMPFSTSFLSEYYNGVLRVPLGVYTINILFAGLFMYRLWSLVGDPKYKLSKNLNSIILKYNRTRSLVIPSLFVCVFFLSFISIFIAYIILPFIPFITRYIRHYFEKKYPEVMKGNL